MWFLCVLANAYEKNFYAYKLYCTWRFNSVIHFDSAFHESRGPATFKAKGSIANTVKPACITVWLHLLDAHVRVLWILGQTEYRTRDLLQTESLGFQD